MNKIKAIPRITKEIIITIVLLVVIWLLWDLLIKDRVAISDQALSTIGLALSASLGVLTAIVVSFVLVTWQSSRQERSASYWRWRNALLQLVNYFDANVEVLSDIAEDIMSLTWASAEVALVTPMPRDKFVELSAKVANKITSMSTKLQGIKKPSKEEMIKGRAYMDITNYIVTLATANFEHRLSHYLYLQILRLRGLLYRLLTVLSLSALVVAIVATTSINGIRDTFNAPVAILLVGWFIYLMICIGLEIRRITHLEDQFNRQGRE